MKLLTLVCLSVCLPPSSLSTVLFVSRGEPSCSFGAVAIRWTFLLNLRLSLICIAPGREYFCIDLVTVLKVWGTLATGLCYFLFQPLRAAPPPLFTNTTSAVMFIWLISHSLEWRHFGSVIPYSLTSAYGH